MPFPHHRIRAPQPRRPLHPIPRPTLTRHIVSVPTGIISLIEPSRPTQFHHRPNHPNPRLPEGQYATTVPTIADRVVQAALKLVLEPILEADFLSCSYGFRPK